MPNTNEVVAVGERSFKVTSPVKNPKKMTGTRLGKVLGLNHWGTPFQAWCEIMRVAEPPFEGNKYTEAGKAIEPKLIEYARQSVSPYIVTPEEYFTDGKRRWDFYDYEHIGGMWDGLCFYMPNVTMNDNIAPLAIIECKTSSRPQDWEVDVPPHYAIQGMLYAYLSHCEEVYFPVALLEPEDYDNPEQFECSSDNTLMFHKTIHDSIGEYANIEEAIEAAEQWWELYVETGISPEYDPKKDVEYLALIKRCDITQIADDLGDFDLEQIEKMLNEIDAKIASLEEGCGLPDLKKQRKKVNGELQTKIKPILVNTEGKDSLETEHYIFTVSPSRSVDYDKLEADGVYEDYVTVTPTIRTKRKEG